MHLVVTMVRIIQASDRRSQVVFSVVYTISTAMPVLTPCMQCSILDNQNVGQSKNVYTQSERQPEGMPDIQNERRHANVTQANNPWPRPRMRRRRLFRARKTQYTPSRSAVGDPDGDCRDQSPRSYRR
jgi:hypothetical protein